MQRYRCSVVVAYFSLLGMCFSQNAEELGKAALSGEQAALTRLRVFAATGDGTAEYELFKVLRQSKGQHRNIPEAMVWLRQSAQHNNPDAQNTLGTILEAGKDIPQDLDQAEMWFTRAAENGHRGADLNLQGLRQSRQNGSGSSANRD